MAVKKQDETPLGEGADLNQELIEQMLGGSDLDTSSDLWSDAALQAEIDSVQRAAGIAVDHNPPPVAAAGARVAPVPTPLGVPPAPAPPPTSVHPVQFMPLAPEPPVSDSSHGIELLLDVALEVSVELGRSHMSIGDILALRTGSVIELDKLAGEPVDVSVNGTLIARGEVVVVDEKFGVRITEVVSRARRIATLG